jgi:hypothetical protein
MHNPIALSLSRLALVALLSLAAHIAQVVLPGRASLALQTVHIPFFFAVFLAYLAISLQSLRHFSHFLNV